MMTDDLDGSDDKLAWIERSWKVALDQVLQNYVDLEREPSDDELEAFGSILGASHGEVRRMLGRMAKAQGSPLLKDWAG